MRENKFQSQVIQDLYREFPGCVVLKNDANYLQGVPDLTMFWEDHWAMLECKADAKAHLQPNQKYYLNKFGHMSYAGMIYPGNEMEVYDEIRGAFEAQR